MLKRRRFDSDDDEDDTYITVKTEVNAFATEGKINWVNEEGGSEEDDLDASCVPPPSRQQEDEKSALIRHRDTGPVETGHGRAVGMLAVEPQKRRHEGERTEVDEDGRSSASVPSGSGTRGIPMDFPTIQKSISSLPPAFVQPCDKDIPPAYFAVLPSSILLRAYWTPLQYLFGYGDASTLSSRSSDGRLKARNAVSEVTALAQYIPSRLCTTEGAAALPPLQSTAGCPKPGWRWDGVIRSRKLKS